MLPPLAERRRLRATVLFRGSITRPRSSLSTLHALRSPESMQDSLPAACQALPGRIWATCEGHNERFRILSIPPPFPGLAWRYPRTQCTTSVKLLACAIEG